MALDKGLGPHQGPPKTLEEFKAVKNKPLKPIKKEILSSRGTTMN